MDSLPNSILTPPTPGLACWVSDFRNGEFFALGWCELLGLSKEPESIEEWLECVHQEERLEVKRKVESLAKSTEPAVKGQIGGNGQRAGGLQFDYRAATEGDFRWMLMRAQHVLDENAEPARLVVTSFDTTLLHSLQLQLRDASPEQTIAKAAPILIWATDPKGRCEWFNARWLEFTGNTLESALVGGRCGNAHPEDREAAISAFRAAFELKDSIELEYRLHHHDGNYRWVLDRSTPRYEEDGSFAGYVGVCLDITHEYEYRQRLGERERMLACLHEINDRERMFLSCAIHDGILQDIIGTDMLLHNVDKLEPEKLNDRLVLARKTLKSAIRHGRRLISELRPMILDEQGLVSAIEFLGAELENRGTLDIKVSSSVPRDELFAPFWSGNVFRIVQGALNNIELHSNSPTAQVTISADAKQQFCVVVEDEGVGFDVDANQSSFGIRCMRERAELFGGSVEIASTIGEGSRVTIRVPFPQDS